MQHLLCTAVYLLYVQVVASKMEPGAPRASRNVHISPVADPVLGVAYSSHFLPPICWLPHFTVTSEMGGGGPNVVHTTIKHHTTMYNVWDA